MSDKVNDAVDANADQVGVKTPTVFEYADLHLKCSCGHDKVLDTNLQGGLQFNMYTTDMHDLRLQCEKCGNTLELYFNKAVNPPVNEQPEVKQMEESNETANETNVGSEQVSEPQLGNETQTEKAEINEPVQEADKAKE